LPSLLEARGVTRSFYGVRALNGVDLTIEAGAITALIGPNGAGKTTMFNAITGVVPPDGGTIRFDGRDITAWRPDAIARAGLTRTFQIARGIPRLSVIDNLMLYAPGQSGERLLPALLGAGRAEAAAAEARAWEIATRLNLAHVANNAAGALSGGQKKLLEIGRALMAGPRLILLDEPIAGVNPSLAEEIADHLLALRAEGMSFLVVEHHMDIVARICDPVIVMAEGRFLTQGRFADIAADPRVQEAYMGGRAWA
jgi:branched-chain amino acid transport system ATP-binding protein/neutral amino acid transport system ATP-binding protein